MNPPVDSEIFATLRERLREAFPKGWTTHLDPARESFADSRLVITAPDGVAAQLVIEVKRRIEPRDIPALLNRQRDHRVAKELLVIAPFISAETQSRLRTAGINYADATGNFRLALTKPAVLIIFTGATRNPWHEPRPLHSLKGAAAGRVVRALCDFRPPYKTLAFAKRAGVSAATASRVITLLDNQGFVERPVRGTVSDVHWRDLLVRWSQDYALISSNEVRSYLAPRGIDTFLRDVASAGLRHAVTGSLAAARLAPIAPPRLAIIYVDDLHQAAQDFRLRPTESGTNILLAQPYDPVVYDRGQIADGITYAAPSQIVVDLLTGPGRGPAEGEELLRWMEEHDDLWQQ